MLFTFIDRDVASHRSGTFGNSDTLQVDRQSTRSVTEGYVGDVVSGAMVGV